MENSTPSPAQHSYVLVSAAEAGGTHVYAEVELIPSAIVRHFGGGDQVDNRKVSRQWVFRKGGLVFTLYDWLLTDRCEPGRWTPQELWSSNRTIPLHIGSKEPATRADAQDFADYLLKATSEKESS